MTADLAAWIVEITEVIYQDLRLGFFLTAPAIALLALWGARLRYLCKKKVPREEDALQKPLWVLMLAMLLCFLFLLSRVISGFWGIAGLILLALLGLGALILVFRGRVLGLVLATGWFWLCWLYTAVPDLLTAAAHLRFLDSIPISQVMPVYVSDDIRVMNLLLTELILAGLTIWLPGAFRVLFNPDAQALSQQEEVQQLLTDKIKETIWEKPRSMLTRLLGILLVAVLVVLPYLSYPLPDYLTGGSAELNNRYAAALNGYLEDEALREDASWQQEFIDSHNDLKALNIRPFEVNLRGLRSSYLPYYSSCCDAAFQQLTAMEGVLDSVNLRSREDAEAYGSYFNYTNDLMTLASLSALRLPGTSAAAKLAGIVSDAFRHYTSWVSLPVLAGILLAAALVCLIVGLLMEKPRLPGLRQLLPIRPELAGNRRIHLVSVITSLGITAVLVVFLVLGEPYSPDSYVQKVTDSFSLAGTEVIQELVMPESQADPEALEQALENQIQLLEEFLALEEPEEPQVHQALCDDARQLLACLEAVRQQEGPVPRELQLLCLEAEQAAIRQSLELILNSAADQVGGLF